MKTRSFTNIITKETSESFYTKLAEKLSSELLKYFNQERTSQILEALKDGSIKINNPENFFFNFEDLNDPSLQINKESESLEEYFQKCLINLKRKKEMGETNIKVQEFFIGLAKFMSYKYMSLLNFDMLMENFILTLSYKENYSPFHIQIPTPETVEALDFPDVDVDYYYSAFETLLKVYAKVEDKYSGSIYLPSIEIIHSAYRNVKFNQDSYLANILSTEKNETIDSLYRNSSESKLLKYYYEDIEKFKESLIENADSAGIKNINPETIITELKRIEKEKPLKSKFFLRPQVLNPKTKGLFYKFTSRKLFNNLEQYKKTFLPCLCSVSINYKNINKDNIDILLGIARDICLLKSYYFRKELVQSFTNHILKITLEGVSDITSKFMELVQRKEDEIISLTNKNFVIEILYKPNKMQNTSLKEEIKEARDFSYFRVISDIHCDFNEKNNYVFNFGDDFVLNCGDTAGSALVAREWIKTNMKKGVVVAGNHLGYSPAIPELNEGSYIHPNNTKNNQIIYLSKTFTGVHNRKVRFISNSEHIVDDIIILGSTLYTDFALYGKEYIKESMKYAENYINDFKLIGVRGHRNYEYTETGWKRELKRISDSQTRIFTPQDHAYFFHFSFEYLKQKVNEYRNKKIIIVTHHAPTPYAIDPQYKGSMLNPAFASNLNKFIIQNPQIRLWAYGHCHNPADFILGRTRLVCCPFGYNNENKANLPFNYGKRIAVEDIKSNKLWTDICKEEIKFGLIKVYNK